MCKRRGYQHNGISAFCKRHKDICAVILLVLVVAAMTVINESGGLQELIWTDF